VGTGKTLSINSGYVVNDTNSGANYLPITLVSSNTGGITPAPLTIAAISNAKYYDGTTTATAKPSVSGIKGSDTVTGLSESYLDPTVGVGKTLVVNSGYVVNDGLGGSNYTLTVLNNTMGIILASVTPVNPVGPINPVTPVQPINPYTPEKPVVPPFYNPRGEANQDNHVAFQDDVQICTKDNPENCICEDTRVPSVQICYFRKKQDKKQAVDKT
jgi:hypothetical protein